ncbi:hypothetical protein Golob_001255 [Gossypium lobatum]|uniref:RNase H type-1 domain-containing protein n=1 Tax=Gossypium lobatum TaxID=34289 RepID=A0A7J8NAZ8_9ROSI|nr:hypothetical protein [Gossypium lobatum]
MVKVKNWIKPSTWQQPMAGCVKMNTNCARKPHTGLVCSVEIAKDSHGRWIFEFDCLIAVQAINGNYKGVVNRVLICKIKELCARAWVVRIEHIYKESNGVANTLAGMMFDYQLGLHEFASSFQQIDTFVLNNLQMILM